MPEPGERAIRRILVGLDASPASLDALGAAASLARRLGAELAGLFVEDEALLRLASFPFAGIVRVPSGRPEALDRAQVEAQLRSLAAHAREALARAASGPPSRWTFRVARGDVVSEVLAAAGDADLLVLGAGGHGRSGRGRVGETARAAAARAAISVLLLRPGAHLAEAVVAVDDGSEGAPRALAVARALAGAGGATIAEAPRGTTARLPDVLARLGPALVVVAAGGPCAAPACLDALLAALGAVLLVR